MRAITVDTNLIARCGLYCGACRSYLKGRCPGCAENARASWCKVRSCCGENGLASCADCSDFADPNDCRKFNNPFAKVIGVVLNSDRRACIFKINELGEDEFAAFMAGQNRQSLPRRGR